MARERILEIEKKFKQDILQEAAVNRSMIMVNHENEKNQSVMHLIPVTESSVTTVHPIASPYPKLEEVYKMVNRSYPQVHISLFRVPISDEQAPLASSIDELLKISFRNYHDQFVFNCQIGRGRTTTGMVICSMALSFKRGEWHRLMSRIAKSENEAEKKKTIVASETAQDLLLKGFYPSVIKIVSISENGARAKQKLDYIIDLSSDMQNIREVIYQYDVKCVGKVCL